ARRAEEPRGEGRAPPQCDREPEARRFRCRRSRVTGDGFRMSTAEETSGTREAARGPARDAGARWLRCDLHVHTPFDGEKRFGEDVHGAIEAFKKEKPQRLVAMAERFVNACRSAADGEGI